MRKKTEKQPRLQAPVPVHPKAKEMEEIAKILDENPIIYELAYQDLMLGRPKKSESGANGMTAVQVVRAAVIKQIEEFSYGELAFHLADSRCYSNFLKLGFGQKPFAKSTLCGNIKALKPETLEAINRIIVKAAQK